MYTTFHLSSAQDVNTDLLDSIKETFKSKAITIIVEEDNYDYELSADMKAVLDDRLQEDERDYLTSDESLNIIRSKYGL